MKAYTGNISLSHCFLISIGLQSDDIIIPVWHWCMCENLIHIAIRVVYIEVLNNSNSEYIDLTTYNMPSMWDLQPCSFVFFTEERIRP